MRHENVTGMYSLPYIARPDWPPFLIFLVLGGIITLPLLPVIIGSSSALSILLLIWVPIGVFLLWLGSHTIVLRADRLRYTTLFSHREMFFAEIIRVQVKVVYGRGAGYVLQMYSNASNRPIAISVRPFKKKDIAIVVDAIATHAPSVTLDGIARGMREGRL